jgi:hypothetical protein
VWPFEIEDEENKQQSQISPEQRAQVQQAILEKYRAASDSADVDKAADEAKRNRTIANVAQALEGMGRARSMARGAKGVDAGFYEGLKSDADKSLAEARAKRKDRMDSVLTEDSLGWQDRERAQKQKGWDIDDAYNDPSSGQSKAIRAQYAQMFPHLAKDPGFEGLSANDIKNGLSDPLKLKESIEARKEAALQRSADRQAMLGARTQDKADAKAEKEENYQASVKIPGLEVQPGFRPTPEAAKKVRDAKATRDSMSATLDALEGVYNDSGTNMVGDDSNTQSSLVESLKMELKNLQTLGALSGSDYASLERQIPDPTSFGENAKGMVGLDSFKSKVAAFRTALENKLGATASNAGYKPSSEGAKTTKTAVHGADLPD